MTTTQSRNSQLEGCIEACLKCLQDCEFCATACLDSDMVQMMAACIKACRDCADLCALCARFMSRISNLHMQLCEVCADACARCATECSKHYHEYCRRCAESCRQMSMATA